MSGDTTWGKGSIYDDIKAAIEAVDQAFVERDKHGRKLPPWEWRCTEWVPEQVPNKETGEMEAAVVLMQVPSLFYPVDEHGKPLQEPETKARIIMFNPALYWPLHDGLMERNHYQWGKMHQAFLQWVEKHPDHGVAQDWISARDTRRTGGGTTNG